MGTTTIPDALYKPAIGESGWGATVNTSFDTLQSRLTEMFANVKSYGAVGDGVADDSAEIQAAIDAVDTAGGGVVYLPEGTYKITTTRLLLESKVHIRGAGMGATTVVSTGAAGAIGTTETGTTKTVYTDVSISDMTITNVAQAPIAIANATRVTVERVACSNTTGNHMGILIEYCDEVHVRDCKVGPTTGNGININATDHATVIGNQVKSTGDDGIDIDCDYLAGVPAIKSKWVTVAGNTVDTVAGGNCIRVENSDWVTVSGNVVDGATDAGIRVNSTTGFTCTYVSVTGNVIEDQNQWGVYVGEEGGGTCTGVVVSGNTVNNSGTDSGIKAGIGVIVGAPGTLVVGNRVSNSGEAGATDSGGILLYKVNDCSVLNNLITDCSNLGINLWNGDAATTYTGTTIAGNSLVNNGADFGGGGQSPTGVVYRNNRSDKTLDVASATTTTLGNHSDYFNITGTTTITSVTGSWPGRRVTLKFAGILTFTNGSNLNLTADFVTSALDTISLVCDGTDWYETGRAANV